MYSCIAERDDGSSGIGIELIQEWKLLVADNALSLLWPVLEAHETEQEICRNTAFEPGETEYWLKTTDRDIPWYTRRSPGHASFRTVVRGG